MKTSESGILVIQPGLSQIKASRCEILHYIQDDKKTTILLASGPGVYPCYWIP